MKANENITIDINSFKSGAFKISGSLLAYQSSIHEETNVDLKQEIHVINQYKHFVSSISENLKI